MSSLLKRLMMVALMVPAVSFAQVSVNKVVATVDGDPVTQQDVNDKVSINKQVWDAEHKMVMSDPAAPAEIKNAKKPSDEEFRQRSLDEILQERVLLSQAKVVGVNVTSADVDNQIAAVAKSMGGDKDSFKKAVIQKAGDKGWQDYQRDMKTELTVAKLLKQEVDDKIQVSEAEIAQVLQSQPKSFPVAVANIIYVDGTTPKSVARMNAAKARLIKGESFEAVAAEMSDQHTPNNKSVDFPLNDTTTAPAVKNALTNQALGTVGDVVKTKNGLYLFKVDQRTDRTIDQDKARRQAREFVKQSKINAAQDAYIKSILEQRQSTIVRK